MVGFAALATLGGGADAHAGSRAVDVSLSYRSPPECPSRDQVVEQLETRGLRVMTTPGAKHLSIDVAMAPTDGRRFNGQLTVAAPDEPTLSRGLTGRDCQAVTLSLALVAGLALNPAADETTDATPVATVAVAAPDAREPPGVPAWYVGAAGRGTSAVGTGPALGFSLFVERAWGARPGAAVSLVFSLATVAPETFTLPFRSADLRAYLGRLDGCWFGGLLAARRVVLSPCAGFELGAVRGEGNDTRPRTATRPWAAPTVSVRFGLALTHRVWLAAAGHAFAPLVRDTYVFDAPSETIHRTPAVGGGLEIGLAGAFW